MTYSEKNIHLIIVQILIWLSLLLTPACIEFVSNQDIGKALNAITVTGKFVLPSAILYFINFYGFVPYLLFRKRAILFYLVNFLAISGIHLWMFTPTFQLQENWKVAFWSLAAASFIINIVFVGCATGLRYIVRWNDLNVRLKEEKQKSAEAELAFLKNQLNPHFLFNTLNNISSLVQIDADTAQDSIGQLSDLLRYTLYDSNQALVPIEGEIEFMNNYINLMKLRCNEKTTVETELQQPPKSGQIAPLLFISLIENAFKHGVNSRKESFIRIRFGAQGEQLVFTCENSYYPKTEMDRIGSGIGLENLKRRLELTYPDCYQYVQELRGDIYFVQITLQNCL